MWWHKTYAVNDAFPEIRAKWEQIAERGWNSAWAEDFNLAKTWSEEGKVNSQQSNANTLRSHEAIKHCNKSRVWWAKPTAIEESWEG